MGASRRYKSLIICECSLGRNIFDPTLFRHLQSKPVILHYMWINNLISNCSLVIHEAACNQFNLNLLMVWSQNGS
jgi:hypothetical protein